MNVKIGQRRGAKYLRIEEYISKRISELCRKRGYSKYRLSQLTGMSQTALGNIMSRDSIPTIPTLEKICDAFGISLAQFFAGDSGKLDSTSDQTELLDIWDGPCEAYKIKASQNLHKKISTHLLTVLIIDVILHVEQRKRKEWRNDLC